MNNRIYNDLTDESEKIIQDKRILIKLKEHQKTAIKAMLDFEETGKVSFTRNAFITNYTIYDETHFSKYYYKHGYDYPRVSTLECEEEFKNKLKRINFEIESNYGILADKVGSGKTFIMMGLLCYNTIPEGRKQILSSSMGTIIKYMDDIREIKTNIILVPHMLVHQWRDVFRKCILKTYIISKKSDIEYLRYIKNKYQQPILSDVDNNYDETNCIEYYDCIIISATMYEVFNEQFNNIKWARIIIDEVVSIKLPTNLEFKCNFIWFLTATPTGIKHIKRNYIKSLVSAMTDYTINNIIIKNNNDFVDISMNLPNINQIIIKCLTPKELNIVKEYLNDEIVNMINAGNIQEAIVKLNCNVETSDNILEVITKKIKKELHNKKAELSFEQNKIPDDIKIHDEKIKKIEQQIKNLESKCQGLEDRIKLFKKDNCPICLDEFESPIFTNCCNNLFCIKCLTLCSKCPLCRLLINISECIVINDNKIKDSKPNKENILCSKVNNLITLLKKKTK